MNFFVTCWINFMLGSFSTSKARASLHENAGVEQESTCSKKTVRSSGSYIVSTEAWSITVQNNNPAASLKDIDPDEDQRITDFQIMMNRCKNQYIDKTLFIKDVMDHPMAVVLITRPRRFGKSLLMSTLHYFFDDHLKNSPQIFAGLNIMQDKSDLKTFRNSFMNKFPVIFLDFKKAKGQTFKDNHEAVKEMISKVFQKFEFLIQGKEVENGTKTWFYNVMNKNIGTVETEHSIKFLCKCINLYYKKNKDAIILIDSYDTPIRESFINNYNREMMTFITKFLVTTLKTNEFFAKAIITGVTTMGQETLFRDVGSMAKYTVFANKFSEYFGFSRQEVQLLVKRSGVGTKMEKTIDEIFDGYTFGDLTIFNPWSITQYVWHNETDGWTSTDSEKYLRRMITEYGLYPVLTIQLLLNGEQVSKVVADFSSLEIEHSETAYWTYMIHLGYLTVTKHPVYDSGHYNAFLRIPNAEIRKAIAKVIAGYSQRFSMTIPDYQEFVDDLVNGNFKAAQAAMSCYIEDAGFYFKRFGRAIHVDAFSDYVAQMLRGVSLRYNTSIHIKRGKDTVSIQVIPTKEGTPVRVVIKQTNMLKVTWDKIKYKFCPHFKNVNKNETEILIQYSNLFLDLCLRKFVEHVN